MLYWRKASWLRDGICYLVCWCLVVTPLLLNVQSVYADEIIDEANKGQDTGLNFLLNYQVPTINNGPALTTPLGPNELGIQDLFPGYDPSNPSQITDLSDLAADPSDLSTQGVAQQFNLQSGTGETAEAYQAAEDGSVNPNYATIDMRNDNFLDRSREIISGNDPILDEILTACAEDVTAGDPGTDTITRLEDVWTCSQLRTGLSGTCTVERNFVLSAVATQVVFEIVGGTCSGADLTDQTNGAMFPREFVFSNEPANTERCGFFEPDGGGESPDAGSFVEFTSGSGPSLVDEAYYTDYCGLRSIGQPTVSECEEVARNDEWFCRHSGVTQVGNGDGSPQSGYNGGSYGTCATNGDFTNRAGQTVDYTGCAQDRIDYCTQVYQETLNNCSPACGTCAAGQDAADNVAIYNVGSPFYNNAGAIRACRTFAQDFNVTSGPGFSTFTAQQNMSFLVEEPIDAGDYETRGWSTDVCGTSPAADCAAVGAQFENECLTAAFGGAQFPGPVGDIPTYCAAERATLEANCQAANTCLTGGACAAAQAEVAQNNTEYTASQFLWENTGRPFQGCRSYDEGITPTILNGPGRTFSFRVDEQIDTTDYQYRGFSTDICGDSPTGDCAAVGAQFEAQCLGGGPWPTVWPGQNWHLDPIGFATEIANYCAGERAVIESNCSAVNSCGSSSAPLLNGTETITTPGIGPGFLETLSGQNVFGTTVDFLETAFNPGDYGLAAGEYVIADHVVSGNGITSSTIDDGGSYGTNWDFTFTATAVDADSLQVEATLYEIVQNDFTFTGCSQADVQNVENGTCSGSITCTDYTPPCRIVDGVQICESPSSTYGVTQVLSPWDDFTSVPPEMCWAASVDIVDCVGQTNCIGNPACTPLCDDLPPALQPACLADPCWVDAQGNTICLDDTSETWVNNLGDPGYTDDCNGLLGRPECSLQPQITCVQGMEDDLDPTNIDACLLRQRYFDCGTDVTVPGVPGADDVDVTCGAEIRCFGDECANTEAESNPDFVRAAVAATAVTESTKDVQCDAQGDPLSCRIFDGTDNRCKDPRGSYLGIIPDCCDESRQAGASAGDFITYMQLARHSYRLARDPIIASWLGQAQILPSGMQNIANAPAAIGRTVGRAVVSGFNSALEFAGFDAIEIASTATDAVQTGITTSATGFGPIQQFIAGGVDNFLRSIGADEFANSLFSSTSEGIVTDWASSGIGEMVGTAMSVIGLIYTIYNILKILGSIFFACEEEELAFGIQQVNRMCHHVGTYCSKKISFLGFKKCVIETQTFCCFSSPFARIINEQLRLQGIGPDWGTSTEPNCEGIPIADLETVDWGLVDLSEWEAIIFEAGLVPDPRNPPLNFIPTARHPGDASEGGEGTTSTDYNQDVITNVMPNLDNGRFDLVGAPLNQPDPELIPWYDDGLP